MEPLGGLHAAFIRAAGEYPDHTAVVEPGEGSVSYRELAVLSDIRVPGAVVFFGKRFARVVEPSGFVLWLQEVP